MIYTGENMKEKIIFVPGINGTELIRSMASFGASTLGVRVMGSLELAKTALMRSGKTVTGEFLPATDIAAVIAGLIHRDGYFGSASYADSRQIAGAISRIRYIADADTVHEALSKGEFIEKNEAILEIYDAYMKDERIDSIDIINQAIAECNKLDVEVITLSECPLRPLERKLLEAVSDKVSELHIWELFGREEKDVAVSSYSEMYGAVNEVEAVLADILKTGTPLDKCTVALADVDRYARLLYEYSLNHGIDMAFGCGLPISLSSPADLLKAYHRWSGAGLCGTDALRYMVESSSFHKEAFLEKVGISSDEFEKTYIGRAGNLRLGPDKVHNDRVLAGNEDEVLARIAAEFELGASEFIYNYAYLRENSGMDKAALAAITSALDAYIGIAGGEDLNEVIPEILKKYICAERSRAGALYITRLDSAMETMRENLYVTGLGSGVFPGSPKENYILLDNDYMLLGAEEEMSDRRIAARKKALLDLIKLGSSLDCNIHLSYSGYDLAELKAQNASSALLEVYRLDKGMDKSLEDFKNDLVHYEFFEGMFTGSDGPARAHVDGKVIEISEAGEQASMIKPKEGKRYSPTAIEEYFSCPRAFYIKRIAGVYPAEEDDPYEVISAADIGTLAHETMEEWAKNRIDVAEEKINEFFKKRPPVHEREMEKAKADFLDMMRNAISCDPGYEVLGQEDELSAEFEGISLYGRADRIEKDEEGNCLIADFKTGRTIRHEDEDINTCLQVAIYAYMASEMGTPVSYCEYRYLRTGDVITFTYDSENRDKLFEMLRQFADAIENEDYPRNIGDSCKYCSFAALCGKEDEENDRSSES